MSRRPTGLWWTAFGVSLRALLLGIVAVWYQIATGIGTWGLNRTVGWAFDITNFVFWVGIGHAGTLISAVLFLFRQKWRTAVNRSAEAMTLFAVMCAGIFPLIHMGRPWLAFWMAPYPNTRGPLWVNFKSPLLWDVFAISTYLLISAVFWYIGLLPDLATIRDRSQSRVGASTSHRSYALAGMVRLVPGIVTKRSTCCWPDWRRRWYFPSTRSSAWTLRQPSFQAGIRRSFRLTSSRARSSADWQWC